MDMTSKNKIIIFSGVVFGALFSLIVYLFRETDKQKKLTSYSSEPIDKIKLPETTPLVTEQVLEEEEEEEENKIDDLQKIEGIGPKISSILIQNQITTFKKLSEKTVDQLKIILSDANIRIADPATWPEQAALAAQDKWDQLKTLQDSLKGGRLS